MPWGVPRLVLGITISPMTDADRPNNIGTLYALRQIAFLHKVPFEISPPTHPELCFIEVNQLYLPSSDWALDKPRQQPYKLAT